MLLPIIRINKKKVSIFTLAATVDFYKHHLPAYLPGIKPHRIKRINNSRNTKIPYSYEYVYFQTLQLSCTTKLNQSHSLCKVGNFSLISSVMPHSDSCYSASEPFEWPLEKQYQYYFAPSVSPLHHIRFLLLKEQPA